MIRCPFIVWDAKVRKRKETGKLFWFFARLFVPLHPEIDHQAG
jgi:hypothetical protein